jgi:hypothetical protein
MTEDAVFIGTDATENGANPPFKNLLNRILIKGRLGILQYVIFILINQRKQPGLTNC